jgi:hypothetical protein
MHGAVGFHRRDDAAGHRDVQHLINPTSWATGDLTLRLHDVTDFSGTITPGGSAVTVSMATPGQNAALTFAGTAGERVSLWGTNGLTGQILGCDVNVRILKPDGTLLSGPTCREGSGSIPATTLPFTGGYTITVDPTGAAGGNLTLTLTIVP